MLCSKCGANVPDDVKFCSVCGEPMPAAPEAPAYAEPVYAAPVAPKKKLNVKLLAIAGVAVVAVVVLLVLLLGGSSYQGVVDDLLKVSMEGDLSGIEDLAPEAFWKWANAEYQVTPEAVASNQKLKAYLDESVQSETKHMVEEYGSDWDVDYTVICDHAISAEDFAKIQKNMQEHYGFAAEEVRLVHIEMECTGDLDSEIGIEPSYVAKVDGDWYAISGSGYFAAEEMVKQCK